MVLDKLLVELVQQVRWLMIQKQGVVHALVRRVIVNPEQNVYESKVE